MSTFKVNIEPVNEEMRELERKLEILINANETPLNLFLNNFIFSKSKRLRSLLCFLLVKALNKPIKKDIIKLAASTELIHNATLIHDDVIDNSDKRRGQKTINAEFDNQLAVIAGDFLLSLALEELISLNRNDIIHIYTKSLTKICSGEIFQYFEKNEIVSLEEYIEKSKLKTALLFEAILLSCVLLSDEKNYAKEISGFAINFGLAFQIRDDLVSLLNLDDSKPYEEDLKNGNYTAPIIFLLKEDKNLLSLPNDELVKKLKNSSAIDDTKNLIALYAKSAIDYLGFIEDNQYKQSIVKLCQHICEV
ncbi:MAG: polyprenyl synthetase family protein [Candidatus Gastranaerophilales bacterium]|nr:polyprenyl synthetase family protein [Candidatus Gastranaerophilales bacterium]